MKTVFSYFGRYKLQSILSPLFKFLEAGFELTVPLVIAYLIDSGIRQNDTSVITKCLLLLILFAVTGIICSIIAQYFAAYSASSIASDIRSDLFKKIQGLSVTDYEKIGPSNIVTALTSDVNQIQSGINLLLRLLLRSPFIVAGAVIMSFTIDVHLALIVLTAVLILAAVIIINMRLAIPSYRDTRKKLDDLVSMTDNSISGVRVIRSFNRTLDDYNEFVSGNASLNMTQKKASYISSWLNPLTFLTVNLAICFLIYKGALRVDAGILMQGAVVALYNYMSQILIELIKLANLIVTVSRAVACAGRVEDIMSHVEESIQNAVSVPDEHRAHELEFKNVSFGYEGSEEDVLFDISFKVPAGSTLGIVGMTGSGKSTVSQLASGLYSPHSGTITIDGIDIDNIARDSLYTAMSLCLQKARMFTGTLGYNIGLSRDNVTDEDIREASYTACCDDIIEGKEDGLLYEIEGSGSNLSGGQKQRIGIARSLAGRPGLLILDDSTSALDGITERNFIDRLLNMHDRPTVVFISQKIRSVKDLDRIMLMKDGEIAAIAPHDELLEISPEYRAIWELQSKEDL